MTDPHRQPDGTPKSTGRPVHESVAQIRIDDTAVGSGRVVIHVEHPDHDGGVRAFYRHQDSAIAATLWDHLAEYDIPSGDDGPEGGDTDA
jgi:hypothetical protein